MNRNKIWLYISALLCMLLTFTGCDPQTTELVNAVIEQQLEAQYQEESSYADEVVDDDESVDEYEASDDSAAANEDETASEDTIAEESDITGDQKDLESVDSEAVISEDGHYTSCEDVALYLYTYGELPDNFITKNEARKLGWDSKKGNLHEVAPGMSIGGDRFGNYEQILPDNDYKECDINYHGGYRGDERIVFSDDGEIYYTDDHYASFIRLY